MKIRKYEAFLYACECKSVSLAAQKMGNSQSSVTQLIGALEKDLGFRLLVRNKAGVKLTDEGRLVYNSIKKVVEDNQRVFELARQINDYNDSTIRVGAFKSIAVNLLPHIIKEFGKLYPNVNFIISDGHYSEIEEKLRMKEIDVGFVSMPFDEDCYCVKLMEDELFAVLPPNHTLAALDAVSAKHFKDQPVVSLIDSTDRDARRYLEQNGIKPNTKFKTADDYAMLSMVESDLGICIAHGLVMVKDNHNVITRPLEPKAFREIGLAVPGFEKQSEMVHRFTEFVVEWAQKMEVR